MAFIKIFRIKKFYRIKKNIKNWKFWFSFWKFDFRFENFWLSFWKFWFSFWKFLIVILKILIFVLKIFDCHFENCNFRFDLLLSFSPCYLFDNFDFQFDNFIVGAKSLPKIVKSNVQIVVLQSEFFSVRKIHKMVEN